MRHGLCVNVSQTAVFMYMCDDFSISLMAIEASFQITLDILLFDGHVQARVSWKDHVCMLQHFQMIKLSAAILQPFCLSL